MTVGESRNASRLEVIAVLRDVLTVLDDERVLDAPEQLDSVAAALAFMQPVADALAQKPRPMAPRPLFGVPVHALPGYSGPPIFVGKGGDLHVMAD